jgi:5-methylthioadenosine/S-adenosylhomocysteine deaminase
MGNTLFKNSKYLISKAHPDEIIENGAVYVEGAVIKAVGNSNDLVSLYGGGDGVDILDCSDKVVMPGLIDAHNHLANFHMRLPYGVTAKDTGIEHGMLNRVWPAYLWLTDESTYDLTVWGLMHQLKHGATTSANAFPFPDAQYRAAEFAKMRMVIQPLMVTSLRLSDNLDEQGCLQQTEETIKNYHQALDGLITVGVHPSWPWNCTRNLLVKGMELAQKYDVQYATHLYEASDEVRKSNALWADEGGAFQYLDQIGMFTPRSLFFHAANLNEREIDLLAERGCAIVHNPENNAGAWNRSVAYIPYYLDAGVTVGLGTDGPPKDMFLQMALAKYFHNVMPREKTGLEPWIPLELATMGSAKALWLEDKVGTLEPGMRADIITIDLKGNTSLFIARKETLLPYIASGSQGKHVCDAMVDGVFLRRDNAFTIFDEEAINTRVNERVSEFFEWYESRKKTRGDRPMVDLVHEEFVKI